MECRNSAALPDVAEETPPDTGLHECLSFSQNHLSKEIAYFFFSCYLVVGDIKSVSDDGGAVSDSQSLCFVSGGLKLEALVSYLSRTWVNSL